MATTMIRNWPPRSESQHNGVTLGIALHGACPSGPAYREGSLLRGIGHDAGEEQRTGLPLDDRAEKRMVDDHLERRCSLNK